MFFHSFYRGLEGCISRNSCLWCWKYWLLLPGRKMNEKARMSWNNSYCQNWQLPTSTLTADKSIARTDFFFFMKLTPTSSLPAREKQAQHRPLPALKHFCGALAVCYGKVVVKFPAVTLLQYSFCGWGSRVQTTHEVASFSLLCSTMGLCIVLSCIWVNL